MEGLRCGVDSETRRRKQQQLLLELLEKKIRSRAQEFYEQRSRQEGSALEDWVRAESEILKRNTLAPLYWRSRMDSEVAE